MTQQTSWFRGCEERGGVRGLATTSEKASWTQGHGRERWRVQRTSASAAHRVVKTSAAAVQRRLCMQASIGVAEKLDWPTISWCLSVQLAPAGYDKGPRVFRG